MNMRRNRPISAFSYAGKGFVSCKDGTVTISTTDLTENRSTAFTVADGKVEVVTRNVKEERLKATDRDEADLLGDFAEEFVKAQRRIIPRRKTLSEGDRVTITGIHEMKDQLWCKPVGEGDDELFLYDDDLVAGTYVKDLLPYLYENDFIAGARVETDSEGIGISIREAYVAFAVQNAQMAYRNKHYFKGRVLFLGVNDSGDPVTMEGRGLAGDMAWLTANYDTVKARGRRLLGHPVPKADSLDHFVLFLQQEKKVYFKDTLQDNITIEPTEDQDAIRITVKPAEYEIAYLYKDRTWAEGTAYVRDGNQTLPMTEDGKRRRLMSLKRVDRDIEHLVRLQEAIDKKHKVILRGYASGNSGEVRDRIVVPINLFYDDEKVWCFDLEDRQFKQFNLARIGRVDTDVPDPEYNHDFRPCQADVFSWVDKDRNYPIRLRMEVMAYNYLVEHFAGARHLPDTELYQEDDTHWILDTVVHGLGPLRWFYVMLADKIEILDSPAADALKEEVRRFVEKHLQ